LIHINAAAAFLLVLFISGRIKRPYISIYLQEGPGLGADVQKSGVY
jgi:hypothetical protein